MATFKQGIFGGMSGRIGNIIFADWKGVHVAKTRPQSVAQANSSAQIATRTKMKAIVALSRLILSTCIKPLWDRFAVHESGYNAFVKANIRTVSDDGVIDFSQLVLSQGKMKAPTINSINIDSLDISISLSSQEDNFAMTSDKVFVFWYNKTDEQLEYSGDTGYTRQNQNDIRLHWPNDLAGSETGNVIIVCYRRADGTIVSNSTYALS
jgi:hypothetical protein